MMAGGQIISSSQFSNQDSVKLGNPDFLLANKEQQHPDQSLSINSPLSIQRFQRSLDDATLQSLDLRRRYVMYTCTVVQTLFTSGR